MSFTDPQTITIAPASALSLPRVTNGEDFARYKSADQTTELLASHQYRKRVRRVIRLNHSKVAVDPISAANAAVTMSMYLNVDLPVWGYSLAEVEAIYDGFTGQLEAGTKTVLKKFLGGES